jgi:hypothetical protein
MGYFLILGQIQRELYEYRLEIDVDRMHEGKVLTNLMDLY